MSKHTLSRQVEFEAEVVDGLEPIAQAEIEDKLSQTTIMQQSRGAVRFRFRGQLEDLTQLKTVTAVYIVEAFQVPRPKALLGHENFNRILNTIALIQQTAVFDTLYISAAGSNSSVMQRIKTELAQHVGVEQGEDNGDLFLRIRRARPGWEVLIRTTPRPLSTRAWRVCNMEGALNASVAHAMVRMVDPKPDETVLNLMCGSASLLIESAAYSSTLFGCDLETEALQCGSLNIHEAGLNQHMGLFQADASAIPMADGQVNVILADLPFGNLVGSHDDNVLVYPKVLAEAFRVGHPDCCFAVITHEKNLMERLLEASSWTCEREIMITLRGLHPRIYLLRK